MKIPFNKPYMTGSEIPNIIDAKNRNMLAGDGWYTRQCHSWFEKHIPGSSTLLTHSCTAALEMAALLIDLRPGDEVIMPSYTFVSTANAFVLRGAIPVFVDIRADTLNIDHDLIEQAITPKTKAIVPVHYAGVACEMSKILDVATKHNLYIIEDAAQALLAFYKNQPLGGFGDLAAFSFHETKNIISGEGGALVVKSKSLFEQAEIIREKGTNRSQFFRGMVDKYTWHSVGSSFLPGELISAFLAAQLDQSKRITDERLKIWNTYNLMTRPLEDQGLIRRPFIPDFCDHNGHLFYVLLPDHISRSKVINYLASCGIAALFHYVPLHSSPAGKRYARVCGKMTNTQYASDKVLRLPLWIGLNTDQQEYIVECLSKALRSSVVTSQ